MTFLNRLKLLVLVIILTGGVLFFEPYIHFPSNELVVKMPPTPERMGATPPSSTLPAVSATSTIAASSTPEEKATRTVATIPKKPRVTASKSTGTSTPPTAVVNRIEVPYPFPPVPFSSINDDARGALVNILCMPHSGTLRPVSGSGVIIDPRGVILTNAHVAQYILLSESANIDLSCVVNSGSPATPRWKAVVLYIPPVWVQEHVAEISSQSPMGTGEHDYALLLITGMANGQPPSAPYPYLTIDTRESIGFEGDTVLAAGYPAELVGSSGQFNLYAVSSVTTIKKLLTFVQQTVDLYSLGGIIVAQGGSSGGAVINGWDRLIGLIVTTSAGDNTSARDLHALTLGYISRDIAVQSGHDLPSILNADVIDLAMDFNAKTVPTLIQKYVDVLRSKIQQ